MTAAGRFTTEQILALPPAITLAELARCLGLSEPTVRACLRSGELARMGIQVNRLGAQYRCVKASVLDYLGLQAGASPAPSGHNGAGQDRPAALPLRAVQPAGGAA